jgi:tRNA threonylcarbamoyl adenosine modification protein (Sua5/YciO/YrdC/YwlC family)
MLLSIDPSHPEPRKVARAVEALLAGEVIGYPTDTVYGLGCDLLSKKGVDRLYAIKGMARSHPLAFICPDLADIARYAVVEKPVYRVLRHYLPGPYCFIVEATREVPKLVQTRRRTVGIRIPKSEAILAITRALGRPVISTTARREGEDPFVDPDEIDESFKGLAMVLDGGAGGLRHTTVIDLTKSPPEVLREGAGPIDAFVG